jgi:hypothetical protein
LPERWSDLAIMRWVRSRAQAVAAALAAALITASLLACGEKQELDLTDPSNGLAEDPHAALEVIGHWTNRLGRGDTDGAADLFAIPSVAINGDVPLHLLSHDDALAFNRSLPCGAKLVKARSAGDLIVATFRLTDRPGGACGSGIGHLARTAFAIEDGHITQWRRLADPKALRPHGEAA